jgi:hypothetical protein
MIERFRPDVIQFYVVNLLPVFKRLLYFSPAAYTVFSYSAFAFLLIRPVSPIRLSLSFISLLFLFSTDQLSSLYIYFPALCIFSLVFSLKPSRLLVILRSYRAVFVVSVIYAFYQKTFGYLPFEVNWISSGLGHVSELGYYVTDEIRAFSFYAGLPEFGFISCIYFLFSIRARSFLLLILSLSGIFLAGSRGIILSAVLAFFLYLFKIKTINFFRPLLLLFLALGAYLFLALILPETGFLEAKDDAYRLLVYGTFAARYSLFIDFLSSYDFLSLMFGAHQTEVILFDNMYLTVLNNFGLLGLIPFLYWLFKLYAFASSSRFTLFLIDLTASYMLYSDCLLSVFYLFVFMLFCASRDSSVLRQNSPAVSSDYLL